MSEVWAAATVAAGASYYSAKESNKAKKRPGLHHRGRALRRGSCN